MIAGRSPQIQLLTSMMAGQILAVLLAIALSKIFTPSDIGEYQLYLSFFTVATILIPLRYEVAIYEVANNIETATRSTILVSVLVTALVSVAALSAHSFLSASNIRLDYLLCSLLAALLGALTRVNQAVFATLKNSKALMWMNFSRPPSVPGFQLLIGLAFGNVAALVIGQTIANIFIFAAFFIAGGLATRFLGKLSVIELKHYLHKYRSYPAYSLPQNLVFVGSESAIPLLLISQFGVAFGGLYWYAAKLAASPMQILVESIRPVIYRKIAQEALASGHQAALTAASISMRLVFLILTLSVLVYYFGEPIFVSALGDSWAGVGPLAAALIFGLTAHAVATPFISSLNMIGMNGSYLLLEVACFLVKALSIFLFYENGALFVVWTISISTVFLYCSFFIIVGLRLSAYTGDHL